MFTTPHYRNTSREILGSVPLTISGLTFWFKGDGLSYSDGQLIASAKDFSGRNANAINNGSSAPILKTNVINGRPVMRFDGTKFLQLTSASFTSGYSLFFVSSASLGNTGNNGIFNMSKNGSFDYAGADAVLCSTGYLSANTSSGMNVGWNSTSPITNITTTFRSWFVWSTIVTALTGSVTQVTRKARTQIEAKSTSSLATSNPTRGIIGGRVDDTGSPFTGPYYFGDIAEIVVYNRGLSNTDRNTIESYLVNKYNL